MPDQTDFFWSNMSDFWHRIPDDDRNLINGLWEAYAQAMDCDYQVLYQEDAAKSIDLCPAFARYKWLNIDLSESNLKKVKDSLPVVTDSSSRLLSGGINDDFKLDHSSHKHFVITPKEFLQTITLPFKAEPSLIDVYRAYKGNGIDGELLYYGDSYTVSDNKILLSPSISAADTITFIVGSNHTIENTNKEWTSLSINASGQDVIFPTGSNIEDVLVFNDEKFISPSKYTIIGGNIIRFQSPQSGLFTASWMIPSDRKFSETHKHTRFSTAYGNGAAGSISIIPISPSPSIDIAVNALSSEYPMRMFVNGKLFPFDLWEYDINTSSILVSKPISWDANEQALISIDSVSISKRSIFDNHVHIKRQEYNLSVKAIAASYDDGGRFDDGGLFDSSNLVNKTLLPFTVLDQNNLYIYADKCLLTKNFDYILLGDKQTISYNFDINGINLSVSYVKPGAAFTYGASDLDLASKEDQRKANMLLFYDEDAIIAGRYNSDSDIGSNLNSVNAQLVSGYDAYTQSIPVLQDAIDNPSEVYYEGDDYTIVNGGISSNIQLPESLWCPDVYLDEKNLAKNFGVLIDFVRDSSEGYKNVLMGFLKSFVSGPLVENIEWSVSIFLGIPFFSNDGFISSIDKGVSTYIITTDSGDTYEVNNNTLSVGTKLYAGYEIGSKPIASFGIDHASVMELGSTRLDFPWSIAAYSARITTSTISKTLLVHHIEDESTIFNDPFPDHLGMAQEGEFDTSTQMINSSYLLKWGGFAPEVSAEMSIYIYGYGVYLISAINDDGIIVDRPIHFDPDGVKFFIWRSAEILLFDKPSGIIAKSDGEVVSILEVVNNVISTNYGQTESIPGNMDLVYSQGDSVSRFQPLTRQVSVYDDFSRKDWHMLSNSAVVERDSVESFIQSSEVLTSVSGSSTGNILTDNDNYFIDMAVDPAGKTLSPVSPGDYVFFHSGLNAGEYANVLRVNPEYITLDEVIDDTFTYTVYRVSKSYDEKFERIVTSDHVVSHAASDIGNSGTSLLLINTHGLPDQGILFTGAEYIRYDSVDGNRVNGLQRGYYDTEARLISSGDTVELLYAIEGDALREVFFAAIKKISSITESNNVTKYSDVLFNVIKQNTMIIEFFNESFAFNPQLSDIAVFLDKITPSSSHWFAEINSNLVDVDSKTAVESLYVDKVRSFGLGSMSGQWTLSSQSFDVSSGIPLKIHDTIEYNGSKTVVVKLNPTTLNGSLGSTADGSITVSAGRQFSRCNITGTFVEFSLPMSPGVLEGMIVSTISGNNIGDYTITSVDYVTNSCIVDRVIVESDIGIQSMILERVLRID